MFVVKQSVNAHDIQKCETPLQGIPRNMWCLNGLYIPMNTNLPYNILPPILLGNKKRYL